MKSNWLLIVIIFSVIGVLNAQTAHTVQVSSNLFTPMNVNITVGDTVVWHWTQGIHTTTSDSLTGQDVWDASIDVSNQTFRYVITEPGIIHYHCSYHQALGMTGTITATVPTGVKDVKYSPSQFKLEQNYPNPFNPSTVISYSLNSPGFVSLKVYNSIGEEIADLVNENQEAGVHSVIFNAAGNVGSGVLASGVYFYRLKTGSFVKTLKMLLLK